jgi:hypothetical protein
VCGPAPLLGCRPIRVKVVSLYIVPHLLSIHQALHNSTSSQLPQPPPPNPHSRLPRSSRRPGRSILPSRGGSLPSRRPPLCPGRPDPLLPAPSSRRRRECQQLAASSPPQPPLSASGERGPSLPHSRRGRGRPPRANWRALPPRRRRHDLTPASRWPWPPRRCQPRRRAHGSSSRPRSAAGGPYDGRCRPSPSQAASAATSLAAGATFLPHLPCSPLPPLPCSAAATTLPPSPAAAFGGRAATHPDRALLSPSAPPSPGVHSPPLSVVLGGPSSTYAPPT